MPTMNESHDTEGSGQIVPHDGSNDQNVAAHQPGDAERPAHQAEEPSRAESFFAIVKSLMLRGLILYFIMSFFRRQQPTSDVYAPGTPKVPAVNIFENGTLMDMYAYLSEDSVFADFDNQQALIWKKQRLVYGDWYGGPNGDGTFSHSMTFQPSKNLLNNGSIYLHVYVTRHGKSPNPLAAKGKYSEESVTSASWILNKFKKLRVRKTHNLLTGQTDTPPEAPKKAEIVSHWHPNLTINMVTDQTGWVQGSVPPPLNEYVVFLPSGHLYKPVIYLNDYWNMLRDYQAINKTTKELTLTLTWQPLSLFRWQFFAAQNMRSTWGFGDMFTEEADQDQDSLKEALLETSPYLLGITVVVTILHYIFELLAFKNDIQFWNNRKSLEGLSVRSVFYNVFQSTVVLLYVMDNNTDTAVRISVCVNLAIEIWKIFKVMDVQVNRSQRIFGVIPRITFVNKQSYVESSTQEYDQMAFKYLSWALFPLLISYMAYSLLYQEHKGWYSWVLSMLYGFLLTFGFIMMTPQLFINYKLKSVAHLPWRMMTYKFLNTFIDDMFAFVIKMPTMYRIGCFRDDIVFFIFLYQRWIYKIDPSRVNEFGFSAEMEQEAKGPTPNGALPEIDGALPEIDGTLPEIDGALPEIDAALVSKNAEDKKRD